MKELEISEITDTLKILFTRISTRSNGNKFVIYIIQRWRIAACNCESSKKNCYFNPKHSTNQSTQQIISVIIYSTHLTFTLIGGNEENIFVVCWMKLNGLEMHMNKTSLLFSLYTCSNFYWQFDIFIRAHT